MAFGQDLLMSTVSSHHKQGVCSFSCMYGHLRVSPMSHITGTNHGGPKEGLLCRIAVFAVGAQL